MISPFPSYLHRTSKDFIANIFEAVALHDIGKVGIKDSILLKPKEMIYTTIGHLFCLPKKAEDYDI